jgi:membrane associated rhomboid family serine protease
LAGFAVSAAVAIGLGSHALTAGASGALFGLMGAVLGILLGRRDRRWRLWLTQAVLFALAFGFAVGVANNAAHVGGLALGIPLGLLAGRRELGPSVRWQRIAAAIGLIACLLSLLLAQRSEMWPLLAEAASER